MKMQNIVIIFVSCIFLQTFSANRDIGQAFSSKVVVKNDSNLDIEANPVFAGTPRGWTTISGRNDPDRNYRKYNIDGAFSGLFVRFNSTCYYFNFSARKFDKNKNIEVLFDGSDMAEVIGYENESSVDLFFTGKSVTCKR